MFLLDPAELHNLSSIALIVLDSLRWDSFQQAHRPILDRWASRQAQRYSYASWTQPSHMCLLSGLLPHSSPAGMLAAGVYLADHAMWAHALGGELSAKQYLYPEFSLALMAHRCGWRTIGRVAMPILNEHTAFSRGFDDYALSPSGSNLGTQIESLTLGPDRNFIFINAGETHYPYLMPKSQMPRISGINGTVLQIAQDKETANNSYKIPFQAAELAAMHQSQIRAMELSDRRIGNLIETLRKPLLLIVVSDHGELFGEDGYFGHGPFFHSLLFQVPVAVGIIK